MEHFETFFTWLDLDRKGLEQVRHNIQQQDYALKALMKHSLKFIAGTYAGTYEEAVIEEFENCLPEHPSWKSA